MAHTFDTNLRFTGSTNPLTQNYTCGSGATLLCLGIIVEPYSVEENIGTPTYNGVEFTLAEIITVMKDIDQVYLFYMLNPPTGSAYQIIIPNTHEFNIYAQASSYKAGTGYTSTLDVSDHELRDRDNPSLPLTTTEDGDVIVAVLGDCLNTAPTDQTGTNLNRTDNGTLSDSNQYYLQETAGLWSSGWTIGKDQYGIVAAAFKIVSTYIDIGIRYYDGSAVKKIGAQTLEEDVHKLRVYKTDTVYGIPLVAPDAPEASKIRIWDGSAVKALPEVD